MPAAPHRIEHDFLGEMTIPLAAYWGVHTARAVDNFPISGQIVAQMPELVSALAFVKKAAAQANAELGVIDAARASAIVQACDDLIGGALHEQFVVDVIQGGAGTSTHMNANEVIANRALEHMGFAKGAYDKLHPNDHVNASQSTNDVYPTALRVAAWFGIEGLLAAMVELRGAFEAKAIEFKDVLKIGRAQLQDAVPMTLGQVPRFRHHDQGRRTSAARGARADHRSEPRRHRHRHRHQRAGGLRRDRDSAAGAGERRAGGEGREPGRGHAGHRRLRATVGRAQARGVQAEQGVQ